MYRTGIGRKTSDAKQFRIYINMQIGNANYCIQKVSHMGRKNLSGWSIGLLDNFDSLAVFSCPFSLSFALYSLKSMPTVKVKSLA